MDQGNKELFLGVLSLLQSERGACDVWHTASVILVITSARSIWALPHFRWKR